MNQSVQYVGIPATLHFLSNNDTSVTTTSQKMSRMGLLTVMTGLPMSRMGLPTVMTGLHMSRMGLPTVMTGLPLTCHTTR